MTNYFLFTNLTEHKLEIVHDLEDLYIREDQNAVFMCEVSLEEVTGEWYRDGHKIRPSSTIKIRTEGRRKREHVWTTMSSQKSFIANRFL